MTFSKSNLIALFLIFSSLRLGFANEVVDDPNDQSEIIGHRLPYAQDCCGFGSPCSNPKNCVGSSNCCGDYCNPCVQNGNPCVKNGCGCVQNPSNRCCVGSVYQPCSACPPCQWQGPCPSCGCVGSNSKFEAQRESDHPVSEPMPPRNEAN